MRRDRNVDCFQLTELTSINVSRKVRHHVTDSALIFCRPIWLWFPHFKPEDFRLSMGLVLYVRVLLIIYI
jgi:hypothetical protein